MQAMMAMMQQLTMQVTQLTAANASLQTKLDTVATAQEELSKKQLSSVKIEPNLIQHSISTVQSHSSPSLSAPASSPQATAQAAPVVAQKQPTLALHPDAAQLLNGAGCINHILSGAIVTRHGALIKDSAKVKPLPSDEKDMRVLAEIAGTKIISLTTSKDRAMAASVLSATRISWPHGGTFDTDTVKLPVLSAESISSPTAFIKWQQLVIDACKCAGVHDILLVSLDMLSNRILNADFSVGDGSQDKELKDALKAALIRACYDLSNQLYYLLKRAITGNEPIVLESLQHQAKMAEGSTPQLWLEGNVNYLWRCLDENYHRVTSASIDQANRAFARIRYGNKGTHSTVSSAATTKLMLDITNANHELGYVDTPRTDSALISLLKQNLPEELWQFAHTVDITLGANKLTFADLSARLISHARTLEERKAGSASTQVANHIGITSSASSGASQCKYCHTDRHTTAQHRRCPACNGMHAPRKCPRGAQQAKGKGSQEGKPKHSHVNAVEAEEIRPIICNVVASREGDDIVGVHYAAGGVELRTHLQCVIDSGAGAHVSCSETHMFDVKELDNPVYVTLPDGGFIRVIKYGSMMLTKHMVLTRVLLVPKFRLNIISVAKLSEKGVYCKFGPDYCVGRVNDKVTNEWLTAFQADRQDSNVYILTLPKVPYEPIRGSKSKVLTSKEIAQKPKKASYLSKTGQATNKPTTIGVKGPELKAAKATKKSISPSDTAAPKDSSTNTGTTAAVPTNMVTTNGGPNTSSSDEE